MIQSLIFDLDGTLVHSLPGIATSLNRVLNTAGLPTHTETNVRTFIGDGIIKLVERAAPDTTPATLETLVTNMKSDYAATWKNGTKPYPGVAEILSQLTITGIPCSVLSNKPDEYCRQITDHVFPNAVFSAVRGQQANTPPKPDPSGAIAICKQSGIPAHQTALIGDSTIDLETAKNAGMISIAATWGYHDPPALEAANPDYTIHSIKELLALLNI